MLMVIPLQTLPPRSSLSIVGLLVLALLVVAVYSAVAIVDAYEKDAATDHAGSRIAV